MKSKSLKLLALFLIVPLFTACAINFMGVDGKGPVIEKEFPLNKAFDQFSASSGWDVEFIHSDNPRIVVRSEANIIKLFQYKIEDGKLSISNKKNIGHSKSREVRIYYKSLSKIHASSGSSVESKEVFTQKKIELSVSSGAEMELHIKTANCDVAASSGAELDLDGTSINFTARASSGASIDADHLKTKTADVKASSGASIDIKVEESLTAKSSSGGSVEYSGNPKTLNLNPSVSGSISKEQD